MESRGTQTVDTTNLRQNQQETYETLDITNDSHVLSYVSCYVLCFMFVMYKVCRV